MVFSPSLSKYRWLCACIGTNQKALEMYVKIGENHTNVAYVSIIYVWFFNISKKYSEVSEIYQDR
jgi:hypothetical protein